jgi:hypothetical protein
MQLVGRLPRHRHPHMENRLLFVGAIYDFAYALSLLVRFHIVYGQPDLSTHKHLTSCHLSSGNGQCDYSKFNHSPSRRDFHLRTMMMTNITISSMKYFS